MTIVSHVCAEFRNARGETIFAVPPSKLHTVLDNVPDEIREDPLYGSVICRCETITEAEILQAIRRPLGARSMDAVKRRVRAGTGRCQAGFCGPKVLEILARELGCDPSEINKNDPGSFMVTGHTR